MLSVRNLRKTYKIKGGGEVKALDGVSIDFPDSGMVFLLGKSGSGKTTLLNIAGGLDKPDGGEIIINGKSSKDFAPPDYDGYRNAYVGFIFQEFNILGGFTVGQNIALALQLQGRKNAGAEAESILKEVGLAGFADRMPDTLSGGQKQRVAIARALVKDPMIIMADEPTGSLDSETGADIFSLLKKLSADRLVVVVSHDRENAEKYGDRIIELKDGKVVSDRIPDSKALAASPVSTAVKKESRNNNAVFIKSRLPFANAAKMAGAGLKLKPLRLAVLLLVSLLAFGIFGVDSTMMMYDPNYTFAKALEGTACDSAVLIKQYQAKWTDIYNISGKESKTSENQIRTTLIGESELDRMNNAGSGIKFAGVMNQDLCPGFIEGNIRITREKRADSKYYDTDGFFGFSDAGEQYLKDIFGENVRLAGRYPETDDEIAVSEYMYETFLTGGLYVLSGQSGDYENLTIASYDDLIGQTVELNGLNNVYKENYIITGIYRTGVIDPKFHLLKNIHSEEQYNRGKDPLYDEFKDSCDYSFHTLAYVSDTFYENVIAYRRYQPWTHMDAGSAEIVNSEFNRISTSGGMPYLLPEWLGQYSAQASVYNFKSGERIDASAINSVKADETYMSSYGLRNRAYYLSISKKDGTKYSDTHSGFMYSFYKLSYAVGSQWQGGAEYQKPRVRSVTDEDIKIIINALNADWDSWARNGENPIYYVYNDIDKFYYSGGNTLKILGVYMLGNYDRNFWLVNENFITSNTDKYSYKMSVRTTKYVKPADAKYDGIISPVKTGAQGINHILSFAKKAADDSFFALQSRVYFDVDYVVEMVETYLLWIFVPLGVILALISALLLFNYISISIADKCREIGILRAVGAKEGDIYKIFFIESIIIAAACGILGVIFAIGASALINSIFAEGAGYQFFNFRFINALIILGITALIAFTATFFPIRRAAKKSPVEAIRAL